MGWAVLPLVHCAFDLHLLALVREQQEMLQPADLMRVRGDSIIFITPSLLLGAGHKPGVGGNLSFKLAALFCFKMQS